MDKSTLFDLVCKGCGGVTFLEVIEPPNSTHHARRNCQDCHRFHSWVAKQRQEISVTRLLQDSSLQSWERSFLKMLSLKRNWSKHEQGLLHEISDRATAGIPDRKG